MTNRILRYSGLGLAVLTAAAIAACSSSSDTNTPSGSAGNGTAGKPGSAGAGGSPGAAGTGTAGTGTAGTGTAGTGTGGGGSANACAGTVPTAALITDFAALTPNGAQYTFTGGVLGGTFTYQPNALTLDTSGQALTIKGNVHDYDGFGVYFNTCYNAAAYTGVSFKIKGSAGPKGKLNFRVQTNANTAVDTTNMKGTCVATDPKNTYPDCHAASFDIPVTATDNVVTVMFTQLAGGAPIATVDPKDVVGLEWAFNWDPNATGAAGSGAGGASGGSGGGASAGAAGASAGAGGASAGSGGGGTTVPGSYEANITIDDIMFVGGPPAGGAGGAGGGSGGASAGAGGASAGSGGAVAGSGGKGGSGGTGG